MHGRSLAEPFWLLAHFPLGHKSGGRGMGVGGEALFTEFTHFTSSKLRKMERFSWKGSLKADLAA